MRETDETTDRGHMIEIEEHTFLLDQNSNVIIIQEDHIEGQTNIHTKERADRQGRHR